jgi:hypothetical protein
MDAAVGLLKRSAALLLKVALLTGVGTGGAGLRPLARDAAVGANKPDEGVFERGVVPDGVFERALGVDVAEGVLGRLGVVLEDGLACLMVEGGDVTAGDLVDVPVYCDLRGWTLGGLTVEEFWGRELMGSFCGVLAASDALGVGTLAGVEVAFRTGGDLIFVVDGLGVFVCSAADGGTATSVATDPTGESGAASMIADDSSCDVDEAVIEEDVCDNFGLSSVIVDFGGHSLL